MFDLRASDALHARAQRAVAGEGEDFDRLACDLARHQVASTPSLGRLFGRRGVDASALVRADQIPAVPTDAFRLTRVAAHPPELDVALFRTSGTTSGARGEHALRRTDTYAAGSLAFAREALTPALGVPAHTVSLMPPPQEAPDSSLGFMCALFGRELTATSSFQLRDGAIDVTGVEAAIARARDAGAAVLFLSTSFALVHLLDALAGRTLPLPPGSLLMQTGGYKGKSREIAPRELRALLGRTFDLAPTQIVAEYGMTELSSQAYELATPPGVHADEVALGVYRTPRWMRVTPVDPVTLAPVPAGAGIARIVDLLNVDSAVAIQTQDLVELTAGGFRLLGRLPGATPRGCSLAIEELLGSS